LMAQLDGTSYFDGNAQYDYHFYSVVAVTSDGVRSTPAYYNIQFFSPEPTSVQLRSEVYSSTAIELFWDPVYSGEGSTTTFTVFRDDTALTTTDGTSFFDSDLQPGTSYVYQVITHNSSGLDSQPTQVTVTTRNVDGGASGTQSPTTGTLEGVTGLVYSSSAVELFWLRPENTAIQSYKVFSNGELLGETDGVSFFIAELSASTTYSFMIEALECKWVLVQAFNLQR